jgi:hypothetical protein
MDHREIEDQSLAERYVAEGLSAEERQAFEEHLVDCAHCQDLVEEAERLRAGLLVLEHEQLPRPLPERAARPPPRALRVRPGLGLALAAGLVVGLLPALALLRSAHRDVVEAAAAGAAARAAAERAGALERSLAEERAARERAEASLAAIEQARVLPVLALAATRGGSEGPVPMLRLAPDTPFVVLAIETAGYQSYAIRLLDAGGRELWRGERLSATGAGVAVSLPSRLLVPGAYQLVLEGLAGERRVPAGRFRFRVESG